MHPIINHKFTIAALLLTLLIIYASSIPDIVVVPSNNALDRVVSNALHVPVFGILSFFWLLSFPKIRSGRKNLLVVAGLIVFAISDELHQSMVPGRTAAVSDFFLDLTGILLGLFAHKLMFRRPLN